MAHDFELTDEEKRQLLGQRLKNLEVQRYEAQMTIDILDRSALPGSEAERAQAVTIRDRTTAAIETLAKMTAEMYTGVPNNGAKATS